MRSRNAVVAFAFIPLVLAATWFLFLRTSVPDIDTEQAAALGNFADQHRQGDSVPESDWPPVVKKLRPKSVRATGDGVYLVTDKSGVTERGVFAQASGSSFQPTTGGDPSYRLIRDRVYRYEIKG